jgi:DNA-binding CsgD family transcriptional regulator
MIRRRPSQDARRLTDNPEPPLGCPLNDRELRTITCISDGMTSPQIAKATGSPTSTIRAQVWSAGKKLHTNNRAASVLVCARHGWINGKLDNAPAPLVTLLKAVDETLTTLYDRLITGRDFRCTPAQSDYLRAFERMLRTHHDGDGDGDNAIVEARLEMSRKLETVMGEAGIRTGRIGRRAWRGLESR